MTKKDYIKFAELFKEMKEAQDATEKLSIHPDQYMTGSRTCLNTLAHEFAHICAQDNPKFDQARFIAACGIT